jgi:Crinkler effector protein N-terminal domain
LPLTKMANHNYELFISFLGDSPILPKMFPITAPSNISVSVLKERVHAERQNRLKGIDARNLILWKVLPLFFPSYNVLTLS